MVSATSLLALLAAVWMLAAGQRTAPGYCAAQGRALTDTELMLRVLDRQIADEVIDLQSARSAADYLARHPACCSIHRNKQASITDLLFGWINQRRHADFEVTLAQKNSARQQRPFSTYIFDLDSCGGVVNVETMDRRSLERE